MGTLEVLMQVSVFAKDKSLFKHWVVSEATILSLIEK